MKTIVNNILNIGVKPDYQPWEVSIARMMNLIVLIAIPQMTFGFFFYEKLGYAQFVNDCVFGLFTMPLVFFLNKFKNYLWATYWFFCCGFSFFYSLTLKMGMDSLIILFYFPLIITMVKLLGRKETLKHMIILCCICFLSIVGLAIEYKFHTYQVTLSPEALSNLVVFNIILSFLSTSAFIIVMVTESIKQEGMIKKTLIEKEILLAEVFHRVKNNLNIVTSLLNLKKNMSDSPEVQTALEDCRNRIYSMALVHQNLINRDNLIGLNFREYIELLVKEIERSFGDINAITVITDNEDVIMDLSNAIPCGLILNELITNSYKYAQSGKEKLLIHVALKSSKETIELEVRDNGPGMPEETFNKQNTLGLELIKSLSEQINGTYSFSNNKGLVYHLRFQRKFYE